MEKCLNVSYKLKVQVKDIGIREKNATIDVCTTARIITIVSKLDGASIKLI